MTNEPETTPVQPTESAEIASSISYLLRSYMSVQHHWSAAEFAHQAGELENAAVAQSWPQVQLQHQGAVVAAIMSSVAFVEAAVNEVFQDAADAVDAYLSPLPREVVARLAAFWEETEGRNRRLGPLHKFDMVLVLCDLPTFDRGSNPYQDAESLILLRNTLTHFKPEYFDPLATVKGFAKRLDGRFSRHPVYEGGGQDHPNYLSSILSAGCASWSFSTSKNLVSSWEERLGLELPYRAAQTPDTWRASRHF